MILKIKLGVQIAGGRAYYWFWHDLLCRRKPFTWQLTRMMRRHGILFWLPYIGGQFVAYQITQPPAWLALAWLAFNGWLIDHLIDYLIDNPAEVADL